MVKPKSEVIQRLRILEGWSISDMAKTAKVSQNVLFRAEHGLSVTPKSAKAICCALRKGFDDLFEIVSRSGEGVAV